MGEYADMMLDGTCCEGCGEYIGDGEGFPAYCSPECAGESGAEYWSLGENLTVKEPKKFTCSHCGKMSRTQQGIDAHKAAKHGADANTCHCGKVCADAYGLQQHQEAKGCVDEDIDHD